MVNFPMLTVTDLGSAMLADTSKTLIFTCVKLGDGTTVKTDITTLTDLVDERLSLAIESIASSNKSATLSVPVINTNAATSFYAREIGVYAKLGTDGTEQLYAYSFTSTDPQYIPSKNIPMQEYTLKVRIYTGDITVSAITSNTSGYVTSSELSKALSTVDSTSNSDSTASSSATAAATSATNAATSAKAAADSAYYASISATNAATSETNASGYSTAAGTSATNAKTSETNASTSANTALTSASAAKTSETNSATSATSATNSASAASTSATNAKTSENNAASSATAAKTSEINASTSATAASTSATNATTSATASGTSATNAATSATNAKTSETNSAASATAAATSATNAKTSETNAATSLATMQAMDASTYDKKLTPVTLTASATLTAANVNNLIICNSSSEIILTLPSTITNTMAYTILNIGSAFVTVSGGTIYDGKGSNTSVCMSQYRSIVLRTDGTYWYETFRNCNYDILWTGSVGSSTTTASTNTIALAKSLSNYNKFGIKFYAYNSTSVRPQYKEFLVSELSEIIAAASSTYTLSAVWGYSNVAEYSDIQYSSTLTSLVMVSYCSVVKEIRGIK